MRSRLTIWACLLAALFCFSQAHSQRSLLFKDPLSSSVASCTAANNFIARTSGLSLTESNAYKTMICGMVTDGTITGTMSGSGTGAAACGSLFDALYIFATNTTTTANLNLCSTSFGLSVGASTVNFSPDNGYTGDGTAGFLTTAYTPSTASGNYTQNSATIGAYILTSRSANANIVMMGAQSGGALYAYIEPLNSSQFQTELNAGNFPNFTNSNARGHWTVARTASTAIVVYLNGSSSGFGSVSDNSSGLPAQAIYISAFDNAGTAAQFSNDQIAAAYIAGGMSAGTAANVDTRINNYMKNFSINVH